MQETKVGLISPEKKAEFLQLVLEQYAESKRVMQPKHEKFISFLEMYYGVKQKDRPRGYANIPVAMLQEGVDSVVADMMDKIMGTDLQISTKGRERGDEMYAEAIKNVVKYQAYFDNWKRKLRDLVFSFALFGNAPAKVIYDRRFAPVLRRKPIFIPNGGDLSMPAMPGQMPADSFAEITRELIYHGASLVNVDIFDFYPHADMVEIDDPLSVIHRFNLPQSALIQRQRDGIYENVGALLEAMRDKTTDGIDAQVQGYKKRRRELTGINYSHDETNFPEMLEWQGYYDINDDGEDELCIGVVSTSGDGLVHRLDELPYFGGDKTYIFGRMFRVQGEFWGIGLAEKMENDQRAATALRNAMLDSYYKQAQPRTFLEENSVNNEGELDTPRGVVHVSNDDRPIQQKIMVEQVMPIGADGYQLYQQIISDGQAKAGMNDMKAGRVPGQSTTATVGSQAFSQASIRFKDMLWMFENSILIPLCDKAHAINQQFIDKPYAISIVGQERGMYWQMVDPTQIAGKVNFESLASTKQVDKQVNIEQMMRAIQVAAGNPMTAAAVPLIFIRLMQEWEISDMEEIKVAVGYQAMMQQLYMAAQQQLTPMQAMAMQQGQYGIPMPIQSQNPEGNSTPYGGEQEQTPTNQEELRGKIQQPMTANFPVAQ